MMGSIVWTTIVLVGMISQTISGDGQAQSTSVGITADQLVEHLANLPTEFPDASDSISEEIDGLLMSIVDPTTTIFQSEFTAEKLLKLKEWNMGDCTEDKLRERKAICQQFTPKSHLISSLNTLVEKRGKTKDEEQRVGASLGLYCFNHFDRILAQCREHLYVEAINQLDSDTEGKKSLEQYNDGIIDYWRHNFFAWFHIPRDYFKSKATKRVYKKLSKDEKSQIGRFCSVVVEKLSLPLSDEMFVRSGGEKRVLWRNYYKYCQITLEEFGKHNRKVAAHSEPII